MEFKYLFYLYPFRPGADYFAHGALSFDYVPRVAVGKVRRRPEAKYARVNLVIVRGMDPDRKFERNRATARQSCLARADEVSDNICRQLMAFKTLRHVMVKFRGEAASDLFYSYPVTALSYAFTLARIGRTAEANAELRKVLKGDYFPPETHATLFKELEAVR